MPEQHAKRSKGSKMSRRLWLTGTAGLVGGMAIKTVYDAVNTASAASPSTVSQPPLPQKQQGISQSVPKDPTKVPGRLASELGQRAPYEHPRRLVVKPQLSGYSVTPLQDLRGIITPADLHFERHHGGIPAIDPQQYRLLIHGMVDRPMRFSLSDLKRFPSISRFYFLECSGNGFLSVPSEKSTPEISPQRLDGLISTSEWTGVPLRMLLREAGVNPRAKWLLAEGNDAAVMTRSIPLEKALDDALIAYGQNGEALRPEQGYPARLFLPGWEGNTMIKWIRRIEVSDQPFMTREETSKYTDPLPDCTARLFSFEMDAKSIITFPAFPYRLPQKGWWEITGLAWSGRGRIVRVEVSTDGGRNWRRAVLQSPVLPKCQTRFNFLWNWNGKPATLMSRATDETGYVQPERELFLRKRGAGTFYHANQIRAWKVQKDGRVLFDI